MQASTSPSKKKKRVSSLFSTRFSLYNHEFAGEKKKSLKEGGKKKADSNFLSKQLFLTESEKGKEGVMIE